MGSTGAERDPGPFDGFESTVITLGLGGVILMLLGLVVMAVSWAVSWAIGGGGVNQIIGDVGAGMGACGVGIVCLLTVLFYLVLMFSAVAGYVRSTRTSSERRRRDRATRDPIVLLPQLAHNLGTVVTSRHGEKTTTFALFPIEIPRPQTNRTVASIRCGHCQEQVRCTVYSFQKMRRVRWRRLLIGLGLAGGMVAAWYSWVTFRAWYYLHYRVGHSGWVGLTNFLVVLLSLLSIGFIAAMCNLPWNLEGVKVPRKAGLHNVRRAGDTASVVKPSPKHTPSGK